MATPSIRRGLETLAPRRLAAVVGAVLNERSLRVVAGLIEVYVGEVEEQMDTLIGIEHFVRSANIEADMRQAYERTFAIACPEAASAAHETWDWPENLPTLIPEPVAIEVARALGSKEGREARDLRDHVKDFPNL